MALIDQAALLDTHDAILPWDEDSQCPVQPPQVNWFARMAEMEGLVDVDGEPLMALPI